MVERRLTRCSLAGQITLICADRKHWSFKENPTRSTDLATAGQAHLSCISMQNQHAVRASFAHAGRRNRSRTSPVPPIVALVKHDGDLSTKGLMSHEFRTSPCRSTRRDQSREDAHHGNGIEGRSPGPPGPRLARDALGHGTTAPGRRADPRQSGSGGAVLDHDAPRHRGGRQIGRGPGHTRPAPGKVPASILSTSADTPPASVRVVAPGRASAV